MRQAKKSTKTNRKWNPTNSFTRCLLRRDQRLDMQVADLADIF